MTVARQLVTKMIFKVDRRGLKSYESEVKRMIRELEKLSSLANAPLRPRVFTGGLKRAMENVGLLNQDIKNLQKNTAKPMRLHMNVTGKSKIDAVEKSIDRVSKKSSILKTALGLGGAYFSGRAIIGAGKSVINSAGDYEIAKMGMENIFGKKRAASDMAGLRTMAAETPFELNDIMKAYTRANAAGFKIDIPMLRKLGDSAAYSSMGFGELIETMISAKKGLTSMVDNVYGQQATQNGDYLDFEATEMGTGRKIKRSVKKGDAQGILDFYLASADRKGVAGMMKKQSGSMPGKISTLKDNLRSMSVEMWEGGLKEPVHALTDGMINLVKEMKPFALQAGQLAKEWLPKLADGIKSLTPLMKPLAAGVATVTLYYTGLAAISTGKWIKAAVLGMKTLKWAAVKAYLATFAIPIAIGAAVAAVAWLGYEIYRFATEGKGLIKTLSDKFPEFGKVVKEVGDIFKDVWELIKPDVLWLWKKMKDLGSKVMPALKKAAELTFKNAVIPFLRDSVKEVKMLVDQFKLLYEFWMPKIKDWFQTIKQLIEDIGNKFKWGLPQKFMDWASPVMNLLDKINTAAGGSSAPATEAPNYGSKGFRVYDTAGNSHMAPGWLKGILHEKDREKLDPDAYFDSWRKRNGKWVQGGHRSLDWHGRVGAPVFSAKGGKIIQITPDGYLGRVKVKHADGSVLDYLHIKPTAGLKVGQEVGKGTNLGKIINIERLGKGRSHVHLGLTSASGQRLDPLNPKNFNAHTVAKQGGGPQVNTKLEQHNHFHGPADPSKVKKATSQGGDVVIKRINQSLGGLPGLSPAL